MAPFGMQRRRVCHQDKLRHIRAHMNGEDLRPCHQYAKDKPIELTNFNKLATLAADWTLGSNQFRSSLAILNVSIANVIACHFS